MLGTRRNFGKFIAATSANFEKGREKHLNEGSGYRRERMRVPLPAGMGRRSRRRGIIAPFLRTPAGSTRVETWPGAVAHLQQRWHSL